MGHMSELHIGHGHNGPDLAWQALLNTGSRSAVEETTALLSDRCSEVYGYASALLCRLEGNAVQKMGAYDVTLTSKAMGYTAHLSDQEYSGFVWLQQNYVRPQASPLEFLAEKSRVRLLIGTRKDPTRAVSLFSLSPADILYRQDIYFKPGGNSELNQMWSLLGRIKDAAFPRNKQQEAERLADREADMQKRMRSHKEAQYVSSSS
jgi:hypothetical protein